MSYVYHATEKIRLPSIKPTEHAYTELHYARSELHGREREFEPSKLTPGSKNTQRYLDSVAKEINHRGEALKYQIFERGKLLCDAKNLLPHGKFGNWVETKTIFSIETARNFRHVYTACVG